MFDAFVAFQARLQPRAPAILTPTRRVSFAELDADTDRLAAGLAGLGLTPSTGVVSIRLGDPYLQHGVALALARLGIASSPAYDAGADLLLSDQACDEPHRLLAPDWLAATLAAPPTPVAWSSAPAPDALGRVMLSSGTTRTPRRVGLSWRMIDANIRNVAVTSGAGRKGVWAPFTGFDTILGFNLALTAWAVGAAVAIDIAEAALADAIEAWRLDLIGLAPVHLRDLLNALPPGFAPQPALRLNVAGGPLPPAVARAARMRITPDVRITYGATECSGATSGDAALLDQAAGAVGYAVPGVRIEVVDADGAPTPPGVQGEVRISSERTVRAYLDDPALSAVTFRNGAFHPGDLGRLLPDGLLIIDGRIDERMNLGGHKILPNLIEDAALACPGVADAAAFAAPDAEGIDHGWLAVVRGEGFERERLVAHLAASATPLPPVRFAWIEAIPRNAMGKIERERLRIAILTVLGGAEPGNEAGTGRI